MTPYQCEVLDGHRELVADCGTTVTMAGQTALLPVVLVFPDASLDMLGAGFQAKAMVNFQVERTLAVGAGLAQESNLTVAGQAQNLHVASIEDDPGSPLVYVTCEEVQ